MKKQISVILASIMILSALTACGGSKPAAPAATTAAPASAAAAPAAPAATEAPANQEKYTLKMGHTFAIDDNFAVAAQKMADEVKEKTGGAVEIVIYPAGQLGTTVGVVEATANKYQDASGDAINALDGYNPLADIESYPFLFSSAEQCVKFLQSDLCKDMMKEIGGDKFEILGVQYRGPRMLQTTKPIHNINDLKGLKLRTGTQPILNYPWEALGCATATMSFTEVYTALQQKSVDGQENPLQQSYAAGFTEVEKYFMNTEHVYGYMAFFFNKEVFNSLPAEYQEIIRTAADNAAEWRTKLQMESEGDYHQLFLDAGMEYIEVDDLEEWKKALEEPLKKQFPDLQPWVEKIKEFNSKG